MKVSTILDMIDIGAFALPEFQRGYVWNRDQVRSLMQSLYKRYPVGSLLVWATKSGTAQTRGSEASNEGVVKLLLDGQQRITSLYGIIRGKPPKFFDGNAQAFTGLYFNIEDEVFEFYAPTKMKDNPRWINVTELMQKGIGSIISEMNAHPELSDKLNMYIERANAVDGIKNIDLHVEEVTGEDKTVDVVVEIFNRVNSGGTKLSKGDLALAKICAEWAEAREEMKECLARWEQAGFYFKLDWLLRNVNTILTGEAMFSALKRVDAGEFQHGLQNAEKSINYMLNVISGRLGLDHDRVVGARYAFPVMTRYIIQNGGKFKDARERDRVLYWYVHSFLWGRYAGSTESVLNQDLGLIEDHEGAIDRLIEQLRRMRGDLVVRPEDFSGWSIGARFYPMLYLLTRVCGARDWGSGIPLSANMLGKLNSLQVHHIFPKKVLYERDYTRAEVNAVANFCFLTQDTNLAISAKRPEEYLAEIEENHPGALASQWIPMDKELWKSENYLEFLAERRKLLAQAANQFLDELLSGTSTDITADDIPTKLVAGTSTQASGEDEELETLLEWIDSEGIPDPELHYEVSDPETGDFLTIVDAAWPNGVQEGFSEPVALLLERNEKNEEILNRCGYRFYTDIESLKRYLEDILDGSGSSSMAG